MLGFVTLFLVTLLRPQLPINSIHSSQTKQKLQQTTTQKCLTQKHLCGCSQTNVMDFLIVKVAVKIGKALRRGEYLVQQQARYAKTALAALDLAQHIKLKH